MSLLFNHLRAVCVVQISSLYKLLYPCMICDYCGLNSILFEMGVTRWLGLWDVRSERHKVGGSNPPHPTSMTNTDIH